MSELETTLALERRVWDALVAGDPTADRALLADGFLGVYPTGFADADDHVGQLEHGSTVESYRIDEPRALTIADGHVMVSYRATYRRSGGDTDEAMYVSSLWSQVEGEWRNVFSQDTPVGDPVV